MIRLMRKVGREKKKFNIFQLPLSRIFKKKQLCILQLMSLYLLFKIITTTIIYPLVPIKEIILKKLIRIPIVFLQLIYHLSSLILFLL